MDDAFTTLHDTFFTLPDTAKIEREIEHNRLSLIENLSKPERKLVLRIIDGKDEISDAISLASFKAGFRLAFRIINEIYNDEHSENYSPGARRCYSEEESQ